MTDDEEDLCPSERAKWLIKKEIKVSFKRDSVPPKTQLQYYHHGKEIARSSYGRINLAKHVLTGKLLAVKSVPKNLPLDERWESLKSNFNKMVKLRHQNILKAFENL